LAEHGCGPVTAAIIIGHTAGAQRFPTDACFARHAGTAPIPASSGNTQRHRLHRGGDRQFNRAIHIIALPRTHRPGDPRLPRAQTHRRQEQARSDPLPQRPSRPPDLAHPLHDPHPSITAAGANPDTTAATVHKTDQHDRRRRPRRHALHALKPANSDTHLT
jgi:transposase